MLSKILLICSNSNLQQLEKNRLNNNVKIKYTILVCKHIYKYIMNIPYFYVGLDQQRFTPDIHIDRGFDPKKKTNPWETKLAPHKTVIG